MICIEIKAVRIWPVSIGRRDPSRNSGTAYSIHYYSLIPNKKLLAHFDSKKLELAFTLKCVLRFSISLHFSRYTDLLLRVLMYRYLSGLKHFCPCNLSRNHDLDIGLYSANIS